MARSRKYPLNEQFFDTWSHDMAYILGFITADGSVNKQTLSIELQKRDISVLRFIRQCISPTSKISTATKDGRTYKRLRINSVILVSSLQKYNVVPNKTHSLSMDFDIPSQYFGDYLRGFFDGDGWVCLRRNSIESGLICASKSFIYAMKHRSGDIGTIHTKQKTSGHALLYSWDMYKNDTIKLRDLMYAVDGFALKRKRDRLFSDFHIPSERWWTQKQLDHLIKNYTPGQSPQIIADVIGKSYSAVSKKIWELALRK